MHVFAEGLSVDVLDNPPIMPAMVSGTGMVTVFAPGLSVAVVDVDPEAPEIHLELMNLAQLIAPVLWNSSDSTYTRWQDLLEVAGNTVTIPWGVKKSTTRKLAGGLYTGRYYTFPEDALLATETVSVAANQSNGPPFVTDVSAWPRARWYRFRITAPGIETCPSCFFYLMQSGQNPAQMPVWSGSYEVLHHAPAIGKWSTVPTTFAPAPRPLALRAYPSFPAPVYKQNPDGTKEDITYKQLYREYSIPVRWFDLHRPTVSEAGTWSPCGLQPYHYNELIAKYPAQQPIDGVRGIGAVMMVTHLEEGRNGKLIGATPWAHFRIDHTPERTIRTLMGWVFDPPPAGYPGDQRPPPKVRHRPPRARLVGDWSDFPPDKQGVSDLWATPVRPSTLAIDPNAPPVGGEQPHVTGPEYLYPDGPNGRVLRGKFSPTDRLAEPKMTLLRDGLGYTWDAICFDAGFGDGECLYFTEPDQHRVRVIRADNGADVRMLLDGGPQAAVEAWYDSGRVPHYKHATGTDAFDDRLVIRRGLPIVHPTGLAHIDGDRYLYVGSLAMAQIIRIDLETFARTIAVPDFPEDNNSNFAKIAVSNGMFLPRGTLAVTTWSIENAGMPHVFLPDGVTKVIIAKDGPLSQGKGGLWESLNYGSAVGFGKTTSRMFGGHAGEGVWVLSASLPTDPTFNGTLYAQGEKEYIDSGIQLTNGDRTFGFHGLPLPPNPSAALAEFYRVNY